MRSGECRLGPARCRIAFARSSGLSEPTTNAALVHAHGSASPHVSVTITGRASASSYSIATIGNWSSTDGRRTIREIARNHRGHAPLAQPGRARTHDRKIRPQIHRSWRLPPPSTEPTKWNVAEMPSARQIRCCVNEPQADASVAQAGTSTRRTVHIAVAGRAIWRRYHRSGTTPYSRANASKRT